MRALDRGKGQFNRLNKKTKPFLGFTVIQYFSKCLILYCSALTFVIMNVLP